MIHPAKQKAERKGMAMKKENAEWFQDPNTGRFVTRLKDDESVCGEGADKGASTRAFLMVCEERGLPKSRRSYIIRRAKIK